MKQKPQEGKSGCGCSFIIVVLIILSAIGHAAHENLMERAAWKIINSR